MVAIATSVATNRAILEWKVLPPCIMGYEQHSHGHKTASYVANVLFFEYQWHCVFSRLVVSIYSSFDLDLDGCKYILNPSFSNPEGIP